MSCGHETWYPRFVSIVGCGYDVHWLHLDDLEWIKHHEHEPSYVYSCNLHYHQHTFAHFVETPLYVANEGVLNKSIMCDCRCILCGNIMLLKLEPSLAKVYWDNILHHVFNRGGWHASLECVGKNSICTLSAPRSEHLSITCKSFSSALMKCTSYFNI